MPSLEGFIGITIATIIGTGGIFLYRYMTDPVAETPKIKMYPPRSWCEFCYKRKLSVTGVCTGVKRQEDCPLPTTEHKHVECNNCGAVYIQRTLRWYD